MGANTKFLSREILESECDDVHPVKRIAEEKMENEKRIMGYFISVGLINWHKDI